MSLYAPTLTKHKPQRWGPVSRGLVAPEWQWAHTELRCALLWWEGGGTVPLDMSLRRLAWLPENSPPWVFTKYGLAQKFTSGSSQALYRTDVSPVSSDSEGTIVLVFVLGSLAADKTILSFNDFGSWDNLFRINPDGADIQVLNKDNVDHYRFTTSGWVVGQTYILIFTVGPNGNSMWRNGQKLSPTYTSGSSASTEWLSDLSNLDRWYISKQFGGGESFGTHTFIEYLHYGRHFTDSECQKISQDPFAPFCMAEEEVYKAPGGPPPGVKNLYMGGIYGATRMDRRGRN